MKSTSYATNDTRRDAMRSRDFAFCIIDNLINSPDPVRFSRVIHLMSISDYLNFAIDRTSVSKKVRDAFGASNKKNTNYPAIL